MKGHHSNFVSIKAENEVVLRIHRPVAVRFSPVWSRELGDSGGSITVNFPPNPPRTAPASDNVPSPPARPSYQTALEFVVQWMEKGGADPFGNNAVPYPKGYREGLERILTLTNMLQMGELHARVAQDLGVIPDPKAKPCPRCKGTA